MATPTTPLSPPLSPLPPTSYSVQIDKELQDQLAAIASKHVTVSYSLMGIVVLMIVLLVGGGIFAGKLYDGAITRAEAAEKTAQDAQNLLIQFKQSSDAALQDAKNQIVADEQKQAQYAATIASLQQKEADRDKAAEAAITAAKNSDKTLAQSVGDLETAFSDTADFKPPWSVGLSSDGQFAQFNKNQIQDFTVVKLDDVRANADLTDTKSQLTASQSTVASLKSDLAVGTQAFQSLQKTEDQCETTLKDKNTAISKLNTANKIGKWAKFKSGATEAAIIIAVFVLGRKI